MALQSLFSQLKTQTQTQVQPSGKLPSLFIGREEQPIFKPVLKQPFNLFAFPEHLGGGVFLRHGVSPTARNISTKQKRAIRGGSFQDTLAEVNHIVSVALGGTRDPRNLEALKTDTTFVEKLKRLFGKKFKVSDFTEEQRQGGRVVVEKKLINQVKAGKISREEAIVKLKGFDFFKEASKFDVKADGKRLLNNLIKLTPFGYNTKDIIRLENNIKKFFGIGQQQTFKISLPRPTKDHLLQLGLGPIDFDKLSPEVQETIKKNIFLKPDAIVVSEAPTLFGGIIAGFKQAGEEERINRQIAFGDVPGVTDEQKRDAQLEVNLNLALGSITPSGVVGKVSKVIKPKLPTVIRPSTTKARVIAELRIEKAEKEFLKSIKTDIQEGIAKEVRTQKEFLKEIKLDISKGITRGLEKERAQLRQKIGFQRHTKDINSSTLFRLKEEAGIAEFKNATKIQLEKLLIETKKLQPGDRFLTEKQLEGAKDLLTTFDKPPRLVTKREFQQVFKEREEVFNGFFTKRLANEIAPTVDIKESSAVIRRVVDKADFEIRSAVKRGEQTERSIDRLMTNAEKTRPEGVNKRQVGDRVFKKISGEDIKITSQEQETVDWLNSYFKQAREDLALENYRKNYITHTAQDFLERLEKHKFSLRQTIDSFRTKEGDLPIDILLNLDQIIGTKKFFRFALERKGIIDPSTNIRKIISEYSAILENKKALDKVLPEGQVAFQLLLQPKSAIWMKNFMKNLKGRGLDSNFRNGKMGWLAKGGDILVDFGYIRLLALNIVSGVKNLVGGEANSFVFQPFNKYALGKNRLLTRPFKAQKIIADSGILDGSYVDIARASFIDKSKKLINHTMYGAMELAEYEIRGSYLLGEMTVAEWKAGTLSTARFRQILDDVAITQGVYSKVDSPLFAQTVMGRSIIQFGRWKITNGFLVRRVLKGAKKEWAVSNFNGQNGRRLLKMMVTFVTGTYLAYEAGKAGWKTGKKIAEAGTELWNLLLNAPEEIARMIQENPALQNLDQVLFTGQQLLSYIGGEEPRQLRFRSGIEDLYFSALKTFGIKQLGEKEKKLSIPKLPSLPSLPKL